MDNTKQFYKDLNEYLNKEDLKSHLENDSTKFNINLTIDDAIKLRDDLKSILSKADTYDIATESCQNSIVRIAIDSYLGTEDFKYNLRPAQGFSSYEWNLNFIQELQTVGGRLACDFVIMPEDIFFELAAINKMHISDSFKNIAHRLATEHTVCAGKIGTMKLLVSTLTDTKTVYMDRQSKDSSAAYFSYMNIAPDILKS